MAIYIITDEWLFHDLLGQNGTDKQEETSRFLVRLAQNDDKLLVLKESPFEEKTKLLLKNSSNDRVVRGVSQLLQSSILRDSEKTIFIKPEDAKPIPDFLTKLVPAEDQYLFVIHQKYKGSVIVTTDKRWNKKVYENKTYNIEIRDVFLQKYLTGK